MKAPNEELYAANQRLCDFLLMVNSSRISLRTVCEIFLRTEVENRYLAYYILIIQCESKRITPCRLAVF